MASSTDVSVIGLEVSLGQCITAKWVEDETLLKEKVYNSVAASPNLVSISLERSDV